MTQMTRDEFQDYVNQYIKSNNSGYISAAIMRSVLTNLEDSVILWYPEQSTYPDVFTLESLGYTSGPIDSYLALAYARMNETGQMLLFAKGPYTVQATTYGLQTRNWAIQFAPDSQVNAGAGLLTSVIDIRSNTRNNLTIYNANIDCTLGSTPDPSQQGCTAIAAQGQNNFTLYSPRLNGGPPGYLHTRGDTGVTSTDVNVTTIIDAYIPNFSDNGIYITGGNSSSKSDDGFIATIIGGYIGSCNTGITNKRQGNCVNIIGTHIDLCRTPIDDSETASDQPASGKRIILTNPLITRAGAVAINIRAPGKVFGSAKIQDWGYVPVNWNGDLNNPANYQPVDVGSSYRTAINLLGARECMLTVDARMVDFASTSTHALSVSQNATINAVNYTAGGHTIDGYLVNSQNGLVEPSGDPSTYTIWNDGVTTLLPAPLANTRTTSTLKTGVRTVFVGSGIKGEIAKGTVVMGAGVGILNAGIVSGVQTVSSITGVLVGDSIIITPLTADISSEPRVRISFRAIASGFQYTVVNGTGSPIDFTASQFSYMILR